MARLNLTTSKEIDELLDTLHDAWSELPEVAREFPRWTMIERLDFIEEWPLNEVHYRRLASLLTNGEATMRQQERYKSLVILMDRNRSYLDRITVVSADRR